MKHIRIPLLLFAAVVLAGCGPTSSDAVPDQAANAPGLVESPSREDGVSGTGVVSIDDPDNGVGSDGPALLSLNITDAAVDDAASVVIQFNEVHFLGQGATTNVEFVLDPPKSIDLLSLQGIRSDSLLENQTVPVGTYGEIRLIIDQTGSFIELASGTHDLKVPSGEQSGAKIPGPFTLESDQTLNFTVDFDLRKSVVRAGPNYILKPVLRIVRDDEVGHIAGTLAQSLLTDVGCPDADPNTGNAVYVFDGAGVTPDDIDGDAVEPVTTSLIKLDVQSGDYLYEIGFLPAGDYTVGFTCHADDEIVDAQEGSVDNDLQFIGVRDVAVAAGQIATADLQ
jgi:hypothetical protein